MSNTASAWCGPGPRPDPPAELLSESTSHLGNPDEQIRLNKAIHEFGWSQRSPKNTVVKHYDNHNNKMTRSITTLA